MSIVPDVERQILFRSGSCNYTSLAEDFMFGGVLYEPGILVPGEHNANSDGNLVFIPRACDALIRDRNIGDFCYIDCIQRDGDDPDFYVTSSHWYLLSGIENEGYSKMTVRLLHPKAAMNKGETIYWSDEFTRRKYNDDPWFQDLKAIADQVSRIIID